jgi:REP element-mobilizing transposase RayT
MSFRPVRKSVGRRDHDYRLPGPYVITMPLFVREPRFGTVNGGHVVLSDAGWLVTYVWQETPAIFPTVVLDAFVVMPDHVHAILTLGDGMDLESAPTLGDVVKRFKGFTSHLYGRGVRAGIYPPYERRLWQERYHDHVIRDAAELAHHRAYIAANPKRWEERMALDVIESVSDRSDGAGW